MTKDNEVADRVHELLFAVRKSRRYHMHFQMTYERWSTLGTLVPAVLAGVTSMAPTSETGLPRVLAGIAAVVAAFAFSLRTTPRAVMHRDLGQAFTTLEKDIRAAGANTNMAKLLEFEGRRLEIELLEPPPVKSVNLLCHNEEVRAGGYDPQRIGEVSIYKRLLACAFALRLDFIRD